MYLANIEILFTHKYGRGPTTISHIGSYPEENPKDHIYEAGDITDIHYFVIQANESNLIIRELDHEEVKALKAQSSNPPGSVTTL